MLIDLSGPVTPKSRTTLEREWPLTGPKWHRHFVGAHSDVKWRAMGASQLAFLKAHGVRRTSTLLDVGCGSLRLGVHAIPWLDPGRYIGHDISERLVRTGIAEELSKVRGWMRKSPRFIISEHFDMADLGCEVIDTAIAQSVLTHLGPVGVEECIRNVAPRVKVFYATFNLGKVDASSEPKYPDMTTYTVSFFSDVARRVGVSMTFIGKWGIPQNRRNEQLMLQFGS